MNPTRCRFAILVWCAIGTAPALCVAQDAPVYPPPGSQQQPAPMYGTPPYYAEPGSESRGRMRQFFANSLAVLMQGSGVSTSAGLSEMVVGGIADWFERRKRRKQNRAPSAANGDQQVPAPMSAPPPQYASATPAADPGPDSNAYYAPVQYYDAYTGDQSAPPAFLPQADPGYSARAQAAAVPAADSLYAGMAYEIHALTPEGAALAVNPAEHIFRTGDQFIVLYRPTLPGLVRVVNVNPLGVETQIDSVEVAAGELKQLGPYRFEATRGEEALRFELVPCSSQPLYATTRDIVKADAAAAGAALQFSSCSHATTRSIRGPATRDIRRVAVEGNTGFAFDPVSAPELASGELAPRSITVMFRHR